MSSKFVPPAVPVTLTTALRNQMAEMCRSRKTRKEAFSTAMPTEWRPRDAAHPAAADECTLDGSWRMVEAYLRGAGPIVAMLLDKPPGRTAYTFHLRDAVGARIYVKLQMGSGVLLGRSFHLG